MVVHRPPNFGAKARDLVPGKLLMALQTLASQKSYTKPQYTSDGTQGEPVPQWDPEQTSKL